MIIIISIFRDFRNLEFLNIINLLSVTSFKYNKFFFLNYFGLNNKFSISNIQNLYVCYREKKEKNYMYPLNLFTDVY